MLQKLWAKLFGNIQGKVSWTKLGIWATDIIAFIQQTTASGVSLDSQEFVTKLATHIALLIFGIGVADKADKMTVRQ
jgi:hypothetical protein